MIETRPQVGSYEYAAQEDRSAHRVQISVPGHLRATGGKRLVTTTRNISRSGFAAVAISRLDVGSKCWLTLPDMPPVQAQVVWWDGGIVGCSFMQMLTPTEFATLLEKWHH